MKTAFYEEHKKLGAQLVNFAGFEMPLKYQSIVEEHHAIRTSVGLFDVSHMGVIHVSGEQAAPFLDFLSTNQIADKNSGSVIYTVLCNEQGGSIDDVLVFAHTPLHFFVVANASNKENVFNHFKKWSTSFCVSIELKETSILALQGPKSLTIIEQVFPAASKIKSMHFVAMDHLYLSRTGYTGELGFEIYGEKEELFQIWKKLIETYQVKPCGLGARDLLRLEMGYALYGHELSLTIAPSESVAAWTVKKEKPKFLGKEALQSLDASKRFEYGLLFEEGPLPREGFDVLREGEKIGKITSGAFSPTLSRPIAIALVNHPLEFGEEVLIPIRGNLQKAKVHPLPFIEL